MSLGDSGRILAAAAQLRARLGPGFPMSRLARPAGLSRATLYRRLAADPKLAAELARLRSEGAADVRSDVLRAAVGLLADVGLSQFSMDAVAARAGCSTATVYRHFPQRDLLLREVLRDSLPTLPLRQILDGEGSIEQVLVRFVDHQLCTLREHPHLLRMMWFAEPEHLREMRKVRRDEERVSIALTAFFDRMRSQAPLRPLASRQLAIGLFGSVVAAMIVERMQDSGERADATSIVEMFLHGVLLPAAERKRR